MDNNELVGGKTSMGMEENVEALLCYIFGWVTGLIFLIAEKNSLVVKFHAWQSILLSIVYFVLAMIIWNLPFVGWFGILLWPLMIVVTIFCMYKAYKGELYKLPLIGDIAYKQAYGG